MNGKQAKKLRWFARAQEAGMPDIMVNSQGVPSTVLVYDHKKIFTDKFDKEHEIIRRTVQYNPRTSGKGYYRALKAAGVKLRGSVPKVRQVCQFRAIKALTEKQQRAGAVALPEAELLAQQASGLEAPATPAVSGSAAAT
jgi:hypothetical protein